MLALGLSRSGTSSQSTRRLRLLRELEESVKELVADGFDDQTVLAPLRAQVAASYASAPPEFVAAAKAAAAAEAGVPRLSFDEIVAEIAGLAGAVRDNMGRVTVDPAKWSLRFGSKGQRRRASVG